ncbi:MAG: hypothetical protein WCK26_00565 [Candidatus Saccharibacteria bacterium]
MVKKSEQKDSKLVFIKFSRGFSYFVYGYSLVASTFLGISFFLLLLSANANTPFVKFVYQTSAAFLGPFRGIFPVRSINETGYFSPSIIFAIIMYLILALCMNALINYVTLKMVKHQKELEELTKE